MDKLSVFRIVGREWANVRTSLERCGDIGRFSQEGSIDGTSKGNYVDGLRLAENVIGMENKLESYGYFSEEAAFVYSYLASIAAERLGLRGKLGQSFARGYSWVRTGWFDTRDIENQDVVKQMIFLNTFFPIDEIFFPVSGDFNWDFNSLVVKIKLKIIFDEFLKWQDVPKSYFKDVRKYRNQLENLLSSNCH